MTHLWVVVLIATVGVIEVKTQENTGTNVASGLWHCYNITDLYNPNFRLPSTINSLIDLIRLVEDGDPNVDARKLAIQLIHRFRQDGIQPASSKSKNVLPFVPNGEEFFKNKIILRTLVPGNAEQFENKTLTPVEQCAIHFMTSTSFNFEQRGDEHLTCKTSGQYVRRPREAEEFSDVERTNVNTGRAMVPRTEISDCPVENGVVYTRWGDIHAGTVLAAIAAGYEPQVIKLDNVESVQSKFAVTLAGDLAEVALQEGTLEDNKYTIGAKGGWDSTLAPHQYYKNGANRVYFTDPELRADIDGLILASNIKEWSQKFSTLKISQLLDMYYSNRGVFSGKFKACDRNKFTSEFAPTNELLEQTIAFAHMYNKETPLKGGSPAADSVKTLVEKTLNEYNGAITRVANVQCDSDDLDRTATDLIIALDTSWNYQYAHKLISYLLDNLDINRYESNYTVINAKNGAILVNSTYSIAKFYQELNSTIYATVARESTGFESYQVMDSVENLHKDRAEYYKSKNLPNGKSSTVLLMPKSTDASQGSYIQSRVSSVMENYYPGTHFIVLGTGSQDIYSSFVRNPSEDIFIVPESMPTREDDVKTTLNKLIKRLRQAPRKIINPKCGSSMSGSSSSDSIEVYIEPGTVNYYKVARHFLSGADSKTLKVRTQNGGNITVCSSQSEADVTSNCEPLGVGEKIFDLSCPGGCNDFNFALMAGNTENSNARCSDKGCRFPDNSKVTLQLGGFTCEGSGVGRITISLSLMSIIGLIYLYL